MANVEENIPVEEAVEMEDAQTSVQQTTSHLSRRRSSVTKPPTKSNKRKKQKQVAQKLAAAAADLEIPRSMSPIRPLPLLICSIGNPGSAYANTLHSAGHTVLNSLAKELGFPGFRKEKSWGNGLLSVSPGAGGGGGGWTLWQSTSYMNESGKGVAAAYNAWTRSLRGSGEEEGKLVIVHDELEKALGVVSLKESGSAKGHNGLKSIQQSMAGKPYWRLGVGIGRPVSRTSDDVARYVLKKMSSEERVRIDGCVEDVVAKLKGLEMG